MGKKVLLALISITALQVWAHGEDRPGPNGGFITMPGPFHVEIVPQGSRTVKAYLLDMNWLNPTIKDSSLTIVHKAQSDTKADCRAAKDHYVCEFAPPVDLKSGKLSVEASRDKQKGNTVDYPLPLKHAAHH